MRLDYECESCLLMMKELSGLNQGEFSLPKCRLFFQEHFTTPDKEDWGVGYIWKWKSESNTNRSQLIHL